MARQARDNNQNSEDMDTSTTPVIKTRETRKNKPRVYMPQGNLYIPPEVKQRFLQEGMTLSWVRVKLEGEEDYKNIGKKSREGYVFVTSEEVPEMVDGLSEENVGRHKNILVVGDVALAKNETSYIKSKRQYYVNKAIGLEQALDHDIEKQKRDRHMPITFDQRASRVHSPGRGRAVEFADGGSIIED